MIIKIKEIFISEYIVRSNYNIKSDIDVIKTDRILSKDSQVMNNLVITNIKLP